MKVVVLRVAFTWKERMTTTGLPWMVLILSLIWPLTSASPLILGSWMKDWPDLQLGGSSPVVAWRRHSMIVCEEEREGEIRQSTEGGGGGGDGMSLRVHPCSAQHGWIFWTIHTVLPAPFWPTIIVSGFEN